MRYEIDGECITIIAEYLESVCHLCRNGIFQNVNVALYEHKIELRLFQKRENGFR